MNWIDMAARDIGYFVLGAGAVFGTGVVVWFLFVLVAEWFIKKYRDWDIFCDAVRLNPYLSLRPDSEPDPRKLYIELTLV